MHPKEKIAPFFLAEECACRGSGVIVLHPGFMNELVKLRGRSKQPFVINSMCRSVEHNKSVGGHPKSLHLTENPAHNTWGTLACDVKVAGWGLKDLPCLLKTAREMGWSVGHGYGYNVNESCFTGFIHLDRRVDINLPRADFFYPGSL